jgi:GGDEF domain-containing protein
LRHGDSLIPTSISYGLAAYDGNTELAALLRDCDRAMYARKQGRRTSN